MELRRIAVVTGTRAEYGLLRSTLRALEKLPEADTRLVVTGLHLLQRYGHTVDEIERDGFPIAARVPVMDEAADNDPALLAHVAARGMNAFIDCYASLDPAIVLVLGDRAEIFAAGAAAALSGRVLAHIHGGDITRGGYDESMRHALTKFAHLHFPATPGARDRLIRMGEDPAHIMLAGAPGVDELLGEERATADDVRERYHVEPGGFVLLVQHAVSTAPQDANAQIDSTLTALRDLGRPVVAVYPNNDPGGKRIVIALDAEGVARDEFNVYPSIPRRDFLGLMEHAGALCGNSSSGVIEAGYLETPVVNIGERQEGRECGANVLHVGHSSDAIEAALRRCFDDVAWLARFEGMKLPYGDGHAGEIIAKALVSHPLPPDIIHKRFVE